jgi:hypothetical protein
LVVEPAWFVPGPVLPSLDGLVELGLLFAPVVTPGLALGCFAIDDCLVECLYDFALAPTLGAARPAMINAATANQIFIIRELLGFDHPGEQIPRRPIGSCRGRFACPEPKRIFAIASGRCAGTEEQSAAVPRCAAGMRVNARSTGQMRDGPWVMRVACAALPAGLALARGRPRHDGKPMTVFRPEHPTTKV